RDEIPLPVAAGSGVVLNLRRLQARFYRVSGSGRRACSLVVVLALLSSLVATPSRRGAHCTPTCPMHVQKLGCHHGHSLPCHGSTAPGLRGTCGHAPEAAIAVPLVRGIMPDSIAVRPAIVWTPTPSIASSFRTLFLP